MTADITWISKLNNTPLKATVLFADPNGVATDVVVFEEAWGGRSARLTSGTDGLNWWVNGETVADDDSKTRRLINDIFEQLEVAERSLRTRPTRVLSTGLV